MTSIVCRTRMVAGHADRLTPLGKRPVIASLSLGATRTFRLKRGTPSEAAAEAGGSGADAQTSTAGVLLTPMNLWAMVVPPTDAFAGDLSFCCGSARVEEGKK